jgi:hypothetical protein
LINPKSKSKAADRSVRPTQSNLVSRNARHFVLFAFEDDDAERRVVSGTKPSGPFSEELFEADELGLKPRYFLGISTRA